jgi:TolA-binding protein
MFDEIFKEQKDIAAKAVSMVGKADCIEIRAKKGNKKQAAKCYNWILKKKNLSKEYIYGAALYRYGYSLRGVYKGEKIAENLFKEYIKEFPNGRYQRRANYHLICCYLFNNKLGKAKVAFKRFSKINDVYTIALKDSFKLYYEGKIGGKR